MKTTLESMWTADLNVLEVALVENDKFEQKNIIEDYNKA
jgi:hypothetical protein